jgi:hypothetical protein
MERLDVVRVGSVVGLSAVLGQHWIPRDLPHHIRFRPSVHSQPVRQEHGSLRERASERSLTRLTCTCSRLVTSSCASCRACSIWSFTPFNITYSTKHPRPLRPHPSPPSFSREGDGAPCAPTGCVGEMARVTGLELEAYVMRWCSSTAAINLSSGYGWADGTISSRFCCVGACSDSAKLTLGKSSASCVDHNGTLLRSQRVRGQRTDGHRSVGSEVKRVTASLSH